jgi:hypothetical protein
MAEERRQQPGKDQRHPKTPEKRAGRWGRSKHVRWGTSGYGTGDQYGGGEANGAGGVPSAGPSYSGGESDLNTGE